MQNQNRSGRRNTQEKLADFHLGFAEETSKEQIDQGLPPLRKMASEGHLYLGAKNTGKCEPKSTDKSANDSKNFEDVDSNSSNRRILDLKTIFDDSGETTAAENNALDKIVKNEDTTTIGNKSQENHHCLCGRGSSNDDSEEGGGGCWIS